MLARGELPEPVELAPRIYRWHREVIEKLMASRFCLDSDAQIRYRAAPRPNPKQVLREQEVALEAVINGWSTRKKAKVHRPPAA